MNDIESMLPSNEQIGHWEAEYFDEGQNFDVLLIEAYKAGYQACEAKYEAAMAEIVNPMDLGIEFEDDNEARALDALKDLYANNDAGMKDLANN